MKSHQLPYLVYPLIILGIVADWRFGYGWAGNLSLFALWVLIVMTVLPLAMPAEVVFKDVKKRPLATALFFACVAVQVAAGWVVVAACLLLVWAALWLKRQAYEGSEDAA